MSVGLVLVLVLVLLSCGPVLWGSMGGVQHVFMRPRGERGCPLTPPWHNMRPMGERGCPLSPIGIVDAIDAREKGGGRNGER